MSRNNFGLAACAAAVLLGWAGLAGAQQRVVLYTSNEATLNKLIAGEFEKATGIAVDVISAGSGVVIKRLQSEKDRPQGDLVWGISRSLLADQRRSTSIPTPPSTRTRSRPSSAIRRTAGSAPTCTCSWCCRTPSRSPKRRARRPGTT